MSSNDVIHSPLAFLVQEEQHHDHQASDALFLTFGADYGYFEKTILGPCRNAGARVCVIGDVHMSSPDVRAAKEVGRTYLAGVAECAGAFHPKLGILVGPRRAVVAIGSGNISVGGWQQNREIWVLANATNENAPDWLNDLVLWLDVLPDYARMGRPYRMAVQRTAQTLRTFLSESRVAKTSSQLIHTLNDPITSQLPTGPVEELLMYAPFHDPHEKAIRALVTRFQPKSVAVAVQSGRTVLESDALIRLQGDLGVKLIDDVTDRYRHGKLIEWRIGDQRWALTGSANLSESALLRAMTGAGNCELGLVSSIDTSLFPPGEEIRASDIQTVAIKVKEAKTRITGLTLLSAEVTGDVVHLERATPATNEVVIQISPYLDDPEHWADIGKFPAAAIEFELTIVLLPGSRVRLFSGKGTADGQEGNVIFVSHANAQKRPLPSSQLGPAWTFNSFEVFSDPAIAGEFERLLQPLGKSLAATKSPKLSTDNDTAKTNASHRLVPSDADESGWIAYRDEFTQRFGPSLSALVLPHLPDLPSSANQAVNPSWDDLLVEDSVAGLSGETAEDIDSEVSETSRRETSSNEGNDESALNSHQIKQAHVKKYKAWAKRLARASPRLPVLERILVLKLLLLTTQSGLWSLDDDDCWQAIHDTTASLNQNSLQDQMTDEAAGLASIAAIATSLLHEATPFTEGTERTIRMKELAHRMSSLLPQASAEMIDHHAKHLQHTDGSDLNTESIIDLAGSLAASDFVRQALTRLDYIGRYSHMHSNNILHVIGSFANPTLVAHEAISHAQDAELVGVWVSSDNGDWTFIAWRRPNLILAEHKKSKTQWRHYKLTSLGTPSSLTAQLKSDPLAAQTHEVRHIPLNRIFPEARVLIEDLFLQSEEPPSQCV